MGTLWRFSPADAVRAALVAVPEGFRVDAYFSVARDGYVVYVWIEVQDERIASDFELTSYEMACARDLPGLIYTRTIKAVDAIFAKTVPTI